MRLLIVLTFLAIGAFAEEARYDNYRVHRLLPETEDQLKALQSLSLGNEYSFWTEVRTVGQSIDVMVPPHKRADFDELVADLGIEQEISIDNVQSLIDEEKSSLRTRSSSMDWTDYNTLEEFDDWMTNLTKTYKNVKKIVVGKTYEKRNITGIEITFGANYQTVFLESGIHAREWIAAAATSYVVNEILKSPEKSVWRKYNYIYVPFFNPDGYAYTWTKLINSGYFHSPNLNHARRLFETHYNCTLLVVCVIPEPMSPFQTKLGTLTTKIALEYLSSIFLFIKTFSQ